MPQYLSLVIDEAVVRGLVAEISGGRVDLRQAFESRPPASLLSPETAQNQTWLRETLTQHGIKPDQVLVTVVRDLGLMRRLDLPAVSQSEWPVHVGFQARTKLAQPLDSLVWDFLPAPKDDKGQSVLFTALTRSSLQHLQTTLSGAGIKASRIHLTPVAVMEYLAHSQPTHRLQQIPAAIVICLISGRLELTLLQQGVVTATHAARVHEDEQQIQQILTEVTRASLAFQKQLPPNASPSLFLNASPEISSELSDALQKRFGKAPELLNLPSNVSLTHLAAGESFDFSHFFEGIGTLLGKTGKLPTIDLLAPRRPQPKRDYRKRKVAILVVGLLAIIGTGGGLYAKNWAEQSRKINDLKTQDKSYDPYLQRGEPILKSGGAVEDWLLTKVDSLDEIRQFTSHFPGGDRMYLTEIQFDPIVGSNTSSHRGTISVSGKAQERSDIIKLEDKLIKLPGKYQVLPHKVKPVPPPPPGQPPGQKKPYSVEFDLTVHIALAGTPPSDKPAEEKPTEGKPGEAKPDDNKPGETKPGDNQPADGKPADAKPDESKPAEEKPAEAKPPEAKPSDAASTDPAKPQEKSATPAEAEKPPAAESAPAEKSASTDQPGTESSDTASANETKSDSSASDTTSSDNAGGQQ